MRTGDVEVCTGDEAHFYGVYGRVVDSPGVLLAVHLFDCLSPDDADEAVALLNWLNGS